MLYVKIVKGRAVSAQIEYPGSEEMARRRAWETRNDWKTFAAAQKRAAELGAKYTATDSGEHVSPRYDVIAVPQVGDPVSYSFNGDTYPDGKIISVSHPDKHYRIVKTDTGSVYYRRGLRGAWVKRGGTWSMVSGHRNQRNPSF